MDHRDRIESPSVERRKLLEMRMEMVRNLINQMNEGGIHREENESNDKQVMDTSKRSVDCNLIKILSWKSRFVTGFQRMFL